MYYFDEAAAKAAVAKLLAQPADIKAYLKDADMVPMVVAWLGLAPQHAIGYEFARAVAGIM